MHALKEEDAEQLLTASERATEVLATESHESCLGPSATTELLALQWAATTLAKRVDELEEGEELFPQSTDFDPAFDERSPEPWWSKMLGTKPPSTLRYAHANVRAIIWALRTAIRNGDGESMVGCAAKAEQTFAAQIASRKASLNLDNCRMDGPALRAYTWAAKVLGERALAGHFGSRMTPEEEAFIGKLKAVAQRIYELTEGEEVTAAALWKEQLSAALKEVSEVPGSDGVEEAFSARKHLAKDMKPLLPTLEADLQGTVQVLAVMALDTEITFDRDNDGDFDENDICVGSIDLSCIYMLEMAVKAAVKLPLEARFVVEAERLLEKRRVERAIIEGIKELDDQSLQAALDDIDEKRAAGTPYGIIQELEPPARRVLKRLLVEDKLEDATDARNKADLTAAIDEATSMGEVVSDLLRKRFDNVLAAAKAMVEKLDKFDVCQATMDASDVEGLHSAIEAVSSGWWIAANHWYEPDKKQLGVYKLAYKRLTVLTEIEKYIEPLNIGALTGALNTALQVKMVDPLVDKAIEILKNIDREKATGEFVKPFDSGGAFGGDDWLANPHFKVTFGEGAPATVKISMTCSEGRESEDTDYFGAFALHIVRMADISAHEAQPGFELITSSEYSMDTAVLTVEELDTARGCFIIPSTQVKGEEGPFVINVICETPGADLILDPVVQVGDLVLKAINNDDLEELQRLLDMAKVKNMTRIHATKGMRYLKRRTSAAGI